MTAFLPCRRLLAAFRVGHQETFMPLALKDIAEKMREIDFTMLFTLGDDDQISGRPMSNNADVEFDGDTYFFSDGNTRKVRDIEQNAKVSLSYQGDKSTGGKPPIMISLEGAAELIRDKDAFEQHWNKDLDRWFAQGVDTPGLVLIKVAASSIHYWDGQDEGEIEL
jgi:general stress protein 26